MVLFENCFGNGFGGGGGGGGNGGFCSDGGFGSDGGNGGFVNRRTYLQEVVWIAPVGKRERQKWADGKWQKLVQTHPIWGEIGGNFGWIGHQNSLYNY